MPKIFIKFTIISDSNLTQTQILTLKLFPNRTETLTLTLILTHKKANEKNVNISYFCFILLTLKIFDEIVTTINFSLQSAQQCHYWYVRVLERSE